MGEIRVKEEAGDADRRAGERAGDGAVEQPGRRGGP
jgi:hypothetical protein